MSDSPELLRRYLQDSSESAFAELVQRYINLVYSVALRQLGGDAHLAEDVTQKVFADLARKAATLYRRPTLGGWLYRSTLYAAAATVRTEQRRKKREQEAQAMNEPLSSCSPDADWELLRPTLDKVVSELNDVDRDVVMMRFFENQPFAKIAAQLDLKEDAARMRVDRALEKLRGKLGRAGITSSTACLGAMLAEQGATAAPVGLAAKASAAAFVVSAGGAATTGAGMFSFMSSIKTSIGLSCLLALTIGSAVYETLQVRWLPKELALAHRADDHAAAEYRSAVDRLKGAEQSTVSFQTRPPIVSTQAESSNSLLRRCASDPSYEQRWISNRMLQFRLRFQPLAQALGLPREKVERVLALVENNEQKKMDINMAAMELGISAGDPAVTLLTFNAVLDLVNATQAELGIGSSAEILKYLRQMELPEDIVKSVVGAVYDSEAPLSSVQAAQLRRIFSERPFDWNTTLAKASEELTPQQMAALRAASEQFQFRSALNQTATDLKRTANHP